MTHAGQHLGDRTHPGAACTDQMDAGNPASSQQLLHRFGGLSSPRRVWRCSSPIFMDSSFFGDSKISRNEARQDVETILGEDLRGSCLLQKAALAA